MNLFRLFSKSQSAPAARRTAAGAARRMSGHRPAIPTSSSNCATKFSGRFPSIWRSTAKRSASSWSGASRSRHSWLMLKFPSMPRGRRPKSRQLHLATMLTALPSGRSSADAIMEPFPRMAIVPDARNCQRVPHENRSYGCGHHRSLFPACPC